MSYPEALLAWIANGLIPEGLSDKQERFYKTFLEDYPKIEEYISGDRGNIIFDSERFKADVLGGKFKAKVFDFDFDIRGTLDGLMSGQRKYTGSADALKKELLNCDHKCANIQPYEERQLTDVNRGHRELFEDAASDTVQVQLPQDEMLVARPPQLDVRLNGICAIDFGTKSTIVVCRHFEIKQFGQMFNTARSINFLTPVKRRVVIEPEEIRSSAEKSLLMGFILTNILQAVKHCHSFNKDFRHITLVEEAHRLLSNYIPGDNLNKKQAVEVFTDMLAEVRKYGESLIIVDQIPDKIIHKLFAQDDKDAVGNAMALSDEQKSFLSNLQPGRAIMFSQGWTKAIRLQVEEKISSARRDVDNADIRKTALSYYLEPRNLRRGILRGGREH